MPDFTRPTRRRQPKEAVEPMIDVVFLLLIFFMMTAELVPAEPFDITAPLAEGEAAKRADTLYIAADGRMGFDGATGEAVFAALARRDDPDAVLLIRADAAFPAQKLAALLPRLAQAGVANTALLAEAK